MKKTKLRETKGITLIALVVTIVVLLILAGISIALLTGEDGIIKKAIEAQKRNEKAEAEEQVKIAVMGSYDESGKINMGLLNENLKKIPGLTYNGKPLDEDNKIEKLPAKVQVNGYDVTIEENGGVSSEESDGNSEVDTKNEITIECDPESNSTVSRNQEVSITVTSKLDITSKEVKAMWSKENLEAGKLPDNFIASSETISVEQNEKTLEGTSFNAGVSETGAYYLYVQATINGETVTKKTGPYQLQRTPVPSDIIITPTETTTTSVTFEITTTENFEGYELQYKKGSSTTKWETYTGEIEIDENMTLYARLYNAQTEHSIENSFAVETIECLHKVMHAISSTEHQCDSCGYKEEHTFSTRSGYCDAYGHTCEVCKEFYEHNWDYMDETYHKCEDCGKMEEHTISFGGMYEDNCSKCNYGVPHNWQDDGISEYHYCSYCNTTEQHNWEEDMNNEGHHHCATCGATREHEYDEFYSETEHMCKWCGKVSAHVYDGPAGMYGSDQHVCSVCHQYGNHIYDIMSSNPNEHTCTLCGATETHTYMEDVGSLYHTCTTCGYMGEHEYNNGFANSTEHECSICHHKEMHRWSSDYMSGEHYCLDCSYSEMHSWSDSGDGMTHSCFTCGASSDHEWMDDGMGGYYCSVCNATKQGDY